MGACTSGPAAGLLKKPRMPIIGRLMSAVAGVGIELDQVNDEIPAAHLSQDWT